jgi:hypothetical protein
MPDPIAESPGSQSGERGNRRSWGEFRGDPWEALVKSKREPVS